MVVVRVTCTVLRANETANDSTTIVSADNRVIETEQSAEAEVSTSVVCRESFWFIVLFLARLSRVVMRTEKRQSSCRESQNTAT